MTEVTCCEVAGDKLLVLQTPPNRLLCSRQTIDHQSPAVAAVFKARSFRGCVFLMGAMAVEVSGMAATAWSLSLRQHSRYRCDSMVVVAAAFPLSFPASCCCVAGGDFSNLPRRMHLSSQMQVRDPVDFVARVGRPF